jgi:hypothetical protein
MNAKVDEPAKWLPPQKDRAEGFLRARDARVWPKWATIGKE